jgi:predicted secreted Zn-dependent protease
MDSEIAEDIKRHFEVVTADIKRHADVVAEGLRSEIRTVAEGVAGMDEKFTLEFERVREDMREQIGEVKSLLRVSYGDLDRRVQSLEKNRQS